MQRRPLFKLGLTSATVLVLAGGSAPLLQPGLNGGRLSASGQKVFSAVGRAVLDTSMPADDGARQIELIDLLSRIETLITGSPLHAKSELSQLQSLLASSGSVGRSPGSVSRGPRAGSRHSARAAGHAAVQSDHTPAGFCRACTTSPPVLNLPM